MPSLRHRHTWANVDWIDADFMRSWGAFEPGRIATVDIDGKIKDMAFEMHASEDRFSAHYSVSNSYGDQRMVRSSVRIERRPMPFGGERVFFRAPCCGKRVVQLALLGNGLHCHKCGSITWESRRMSPIDRKIGKANKLSQQLGGESWLSHISRRPRYMRRNKFQALRGERNRLVQEINDHIMGRHAWALEELGYDTKSVFTE